MSKSLAIAALLVSTCSLRIEAASLGEELARRAEARYVPEILFAWVAIGLGQTQEALDALDRAAEAREGHLIWIGVDPIYDPLRSEPRFGDLLRRLNIPNAQNR